MRKLLSFVLLSVVLVAGCASPSSTSNWTNATNTADTVVNALAQEVPLIQAAFPGVLTAQAAVQVTTALDLAKKDIAILRADIAAGTVNKDAPTIEEVETYINQAVAALAPILTAVCTPAIPQCVEVQMVYRDIVLAVPLLEAFIGSVHPAAPVATAHVASTRASAVPSHGRALMTPEEALADLHRRTGK